MAILKQNIGKEMRMFSIRSIAKNMIKSAMVIFLIILISCDKKQYDAPVPDIDWYTSNFTADTFRISTADELAGLARIVNNMAKLGQSFNFSGRTVSLMEDLDLSEYGKNCLYTIDDTAHIIEVRGWIPIGRFRQTSFAGTFDGNGKTIRGLYIEGAIYNAGLFGMVADGGIVKNLKVEDANIRAADGVGAVAGILYGDSSKVMNSYSSGKVHGTDYVGGVVGAAQNGVTVSNCYFTGAVHGDRSVGGVAGWILRNSNVANSYSLGTVSGNWFIGGVAGIVDVKSWVSASYSVSTVHGNEHVGGVVGRIWNDSYEPNNDFTGILTDNVINCAALNPSVKAAGTFFGRVVGKIDADPKQVKLSNNIAFNGMVNATDNTFWFNNAIDTPNGADITVAEIKSDPTLGGRFISENGWTVQIGSLPGINKAVIMPQHF